jgi:hypothetical protein
MLSWLNWGGAGKTPVTERDIVLTGLPRSGTTLTCHLLNRLADTVALHEPMDTDGVPARGPARQIEHVARFFRDVRQSIVRDKLAPSKHVDGAVPDNPVSGKSAEDGRRTRLVERGHIRVDKPLPPDFYLVVKHPSTFTALLGTLRQEFRCFALIRNPLSVLMSWASVPFPVRRGRVPAAERLDSALTAKLLKAPTDLDRQLVLLDWFYGQFHRHLPAESVIRYEDMVATSGHSLAVINPRARELGERLENRNRNSAYDLARMNQLANRLLETDGAYWNFYNRESVNQLRAA